MKFIVMFAVIALSQGENASNDIKLLSETESRIVNGYPAAPKQFPHMALVMITTMQEGTFPCGGSLLSSTWVISASHCLVNALSVQVLFGSVNKTSMRVVRNVIRIVRPDSFNLTTLKDDISLLQLAIPVRFNSNVQPIQLPAKSEANETYDESILTVSGFGQTENSYSSNILRYVQVKGISNDECKKSYGDIITPYILCTHGYPNEDQGSCNGDSGGPLIIENGNGTKPTLVGTVSFVSMRGCTVGDPQGFTRVGSYLDWISKVTNIALRDE